MSLTKNLILKKRTKVVVGTFFQLSGATLEILVSLSRKKNSLSAQWKADERIHELTEIMYDFLSTYTGVKVHAFFSHQHVTYQQMTLSNAQVSRTLKKTPLLIKIKSLYRQYRPGQSRNVPPDWSEPQSCQRCPLHWTSPHTWPGCFGHLASPRSALSEWWEISPFLTTKGRKVKIIKIRWFLNMSWVTSHPWRSPLQTVVNLSQTVTAILAISFFSSSQNSPKWIQAALRQPAAPLTF